MNIDFSPILNSPQYENGLKIIKANGKKKLRAIIIIVLVVVVLLIFWPLLFALVTYKVIESFINQKQVRSGLAEFAQLNGYKYETTGIKLSANTPRGPDFDLPYEARVLYSGNIITGQMMTMDFTYTNTAIELLNQPTNSKRDTKQVGKQVNIFRIHLPVNMPRLFADSKHNNIPIFTGKANNFTSLESHVLEGDFPTYYNVRAEKNDRIDVLSVLSPDVMQVMVENHYFDLWIHDDELQLLFNGTIFDYFSAIPIIFKNAELLLKEIDKIANHTNPM